MLVRSCACVCVIWRQNARMHHKFASVCLCTSVECVWQSTQGRGRGREVGRGGAWWPLISVDLSLYSASASEDSGPGVGKIHWGDALEACSLVTLHCQILNCLKSSYKPKDSHWEMVFASSIRIYHPNTGRGTVWGGNTPPLIWLSSEAYQGPLPP